MHKFDLDDHAQLQLVRLGHVPSRSALKSAAGELMFRAWEFVRYLQDGEGRERASRFLRLPNKHEDPSYYDMIKNPVHLELVRKRVSAGRYSALKEFHNDVRHTAGPRGVPTQGGAARDSVHTTPRAACS